MVMLNWTKSNQKLENKDFKKLYNSRIYIR